MEQPLSAFGATRVRGQALALDYDQLTAGLAAQRSAGATGAAAARLRTPLPPVPVAALTSLFTGASDWTSAIAALGGRFHPQIATAGSVNDAATSMTGIFTLGFQSSFKAPDLEGDIGSDGGSVTPRMRQA